MEVDGSLYRALHGQIDELSGALRPFATEITCTCDVIYTERDRVDPTCFYCAWEEEINAAREVLGLS